MRVEWYSMIKRQKKKGLELMPNTLYISLYSKQQTESNTHSIKVLNKIQTIGCVNSRSLEKKMHTIHL